MEKNIKDYLHLYIGCEVQYPDIDGSIVRAKLTGITNGDGVETTYIEMQAGDDCNGDYLAWKENGSHNSNALNLKLILRPLSDMTEEEVKELWLSEIQIGLLKYESRIQMFMTADQFKSSISKSFDLFGLIDSGLAINKNETQVSR